MSLRYLLRRCPYGAAIAKRGFTIVESLRTRMKDVEVFPNDANASFDGPSHGVFYGLVFLQLMTECSFKEKVRHYFNVRGSVPSSET